MSPADAPASGRRSTALLVASVVLVGLNLRGPVVSLPPLFPQLTVDLQIAGSAAGLLTSLPLLCFGVASPPVVLLARRLGPDNVLLLSLVLLVVAGVVRPWGSFTLLLVGTLAVGVAVTAGNVLVPVLVRRDMGSRARSIVAVTTASYGLGATAAAAVAVPLSHSVGWRAAAAIMAAVPATLALLVSAARVRETRGSPRVVFAAGRHPERSDRSVWREGDAWWLALYFGLQSALFYSTTTWLPALLLDKVGASEQASGTALSVYLLVGVVGMITVPLLLRVGTARLAAHTSAAGWLLFLVGLLATPDLWLPLAVIGGWAQGAGVSLALTLVAMRPVDADYGQGLSALVQFVGYLLAALGPVVVGAVRAMTGDWMGVLVLALVATAVLLVSGFPAAANRLIGVRTSGPNHTQEGRGLPGP